MRSGLAVALSGLALVGVVAVGQAAEAASINSGGGQPPEPVGVTAATSTPGATPDVAATDGTKAAASRNLPGVRAGHLDGACNTYSSGYGDLCLWYLQNYTGSRADFYIADSDLSNNTFLSVGAGQGARVANNSESDWNYDRRLTARVYTGRNFTGVAGSIRPYTGGNFNTTFRNNVESLNWF